MEITDPEQYRSLKIPDTLLSLRVYRVAYINSGDGIIALVFNGTHKVWKWPRTANNPTTLATTTTEPEQCRSENGSLMTNDVGGEPHTAIHLFAITNDDLYVLSTSGDKISLFDFTNFQLKQSMRFKVRPSALVFHPENNNLFAIGTTNSGILLCKLEGDDKKMVCISKTDVCHEGRITGLAFLTGLNASTIMVVAATPNFVVSVRRFISGDEWSTIDLVEIYPPRLGLEEDIRLQLHKDHNYLLIFSETLLEIRNLPKLHKHKQRPYDTSYGMITHATFSYDYQKVFASFTDGSVCIFESLSLQMETRICPTAYLPSNARPNTYPRVFAAHPSIDGQLALGLSDGSVVIIEPPTPAQKRQRRKRKATLISEGETFI